ncbi:Aste57867_25246 [Aphanomyces stellatus]|uniref:Aste57867_25246 protein n=1 Tax=Aphanomyces stellatus TaxID=120398 RepID=A0A485LSN4_9STRA|nr:hypothetical protein As57867_025168 [Aphanomyces stellatus]VFU01872.1 Aste57867_25246 [Aphanomyces stellatus]
MGVTGSRFAFQFGRSNWWRGLIMYTSKFDAGLEFPYDPLKLLHKESTLMQWPEYPFKQKAIDRVLAQVPGATPLQAAGALLVGCGVEARAVSAFQLCVDASQWSQFQARYDDERAAFAQAKAAYIHESSVGLRQRFKDEAVRKALADDVGRVAAKNATIKVVRFDNGDKYEGQVHVRDRVMIPHGEGTLFVRDKNRKDDDPLLPPVVLRRYVGMWMNGHMHGRGRYFWADGSSWDGTFLHNEMQGRGFFRSELEVDIDESDAFVDTTPPPPVVRYYYAGRHICWGSGRLIELAHNARVRIFRPAGATNNAIRQLHTNLQPYVDGCIADYDETTDQHLIVTHERPEQWIQLSGAYFELLSAAPLGAYIPPPHRP